jgi:hypothetical protein
MKSQQNLLLEERLYRFWRSVYHCTDALRLKWTYKFNCNMSTFNTSRK